MKKLGARASKSGRKLVLDMETFNRWVMGGRYESGNGDYGEGSSNHTEGEWLQVKEEVRKMLAKQSNRLQKLRQGLQDQDKNEKGRLSRKDVAFALDYADVNLSIYHLKVLMDRFQADGNPDHIEYQKLVTFFSERDDKSSKGGDGLIMKIRKALTEQKNGEKKIRALFFDYDLKDNGTVARRDFRLCLERGGIDLSLEELKTLLKAYAEGQDENAINYKKFLDAAFVKEEEEDTGKSKAKGKDKQTMDIVIKIREGMERRGRRLAMLRSRFERSDPEERGSVSDRQFERILGDLEIELDSKDMKALNQAYSKNGNGRIFYNSLCDLIEEEHDGKDEVEDVMDYLIELLRRASENGIDLQQSFEHFDEDRSGFISEREFKLGLKKLGVTLSNEQTKEAMRKFEGKRAGTLLRAPNVRLPWV